MNLKTVVESIAPTLATMLGGPLAGTAITALEGAFGLAPGSGEAGITNAIQTGQMTPDIIAAIRKADQTHAEVMQQQNIDVQKLNAAHEESMAEKVVSDVDSARKSGEKNPELMSVAWAVLVTFAIIMVLVLVGCWYLLGGSVKPDAQNMALAVAIAGLVGSIVGYAAANAQTVINYLFGGSLNGKNNSEALASAAKQSITALANSTPMITPADASAK